MAARRSAPLAFTFPLVFAFGCVGAPPPTPAPTPTPTPGITAATAPATPEPDKPAATTTSTPDEPAPPEPTPKAKPSISCEPKAGTAAAGGPKLAISIDRAKVNLDAHKLELTLTRAACKVELKVFGESGKILADEAQAFDGAAPGTPLSVSWSPTGAEAVLRIEVWGHDTDGSFVGVALSPWSVVLAHEEVNFENDSDVIRPSEAPKLEASLGEINKILAKLQDKKPSFFIKGHTDTMGTPEHNLDLSRRRARSIATWMRAHGLKISIAYEGFGEHKPLVKTPDETAEPKNRRIDYFLSFEPPPLPTSPVSFSWKNL
jgi:outer membrane protein OmpA-like peptidoglycan-associated protein